MNREQLDPEIIADLRARSATERDATRTGAPTWVAPAIVEHWPCRACGIAMVAVTADAITARDTFNRALVARGEPEIPKSKIVFCDPCHAQARAARDLRAQQQAAARIPLERELRSLIDNDLRERSIVARLRELDHPDVDGLLRSVRAARAAGTNTSRKKGLD